MLSHLNLNSIYTKFMHTFTYTPTLMFCIPLFIGNRVVVEANENGV